MMQLCKKLTKRNLFRFLSFKAQLDKISPYVFKLGLLFQAGLDDTSLDFPPSFFQFNHVILQQFSGAVFVSRILSQSTNVKVNVSLI